MGAATKDWSALLGGEVRQELDISQFDSCVDLSVSMPDSVRAGQQLEVRLSLSYWGEGEITITDLSCCFTDSKFDRENILQQESPLVLSGSCSKLFTFSLSPDTSEVGQTLQVKNVSVTVGSRPSSASSARMNLSFSAFLLRNSGCASCSFRSYALSLEIYNVD